MNSLLSDVEDDPETIISGLTEDEQQLLSNPDWTLRCIEFTCMVSPLL